MSQTISLSVRQAGPATSIAATRGHEVHVDRPTAKGGDDKGPMGGELLLMGLGGCFMSNLLAAVKARKAPVSDIQTRVEATLEGTPKRFSSYTLYVSARCDDPALLEKLAIIAERGCIAANSLKQGAPVHLVTETID